MRRNARLNGRTFNVDRIQSSSSSDTTSSATSAGVQADNGEMVSAQIQTELQNRAMREMGRQQALWEAHRDAVQERGFVPTIQSFLAGITSPVRGRTPTQVDLSRDEGEQAEEEFFPEMMTAREEHEEEQQPEQPRTKSKLMKNISYSTNISRWNEQELEFQLFIRGTDVRDPENSIEGLRKKGKGKGLTNWQHMNNVAQSMIADGRWQRRVEAELLKKRITEYNNKTKPRGSKD